MGMRGNLHDMTIADLIQHGCQDGRTAQLTVEHAGQSARMFFQRGELVHAILNDDVGEEVVYRILDWDEGTFEFAAGVEPPAATIRRKWASLLLEGAKRIDEMRIESPNTEPSTMKQAEAHPMGKFDEMLKEMSAEVPGYLTSALVGMDGINLAQHARAKVDPDVISAQLALLLKLIVTAISKLSAGTVEDNLVTTDKTYVLMRSLPDQQYFLSLTAERKSGNLGNMRLMSKMYAERISKSMPR